MSTKNRRASLSFGERLLFLAGTLFCLVLVTTAMMGGLFAKYAASGDGTDTARVAKWAVDVEGPEDDVEIEYLVSPNDQGAYTVTIRNNSEVAVCYNMTVEVNKIDFDIKVKLEDEELSTKDKTILEFLNIGTAKAGQTVTHDLIFTVEDWGEFTKFVQETPSRQQEVEFTVKVDVVQID